MTIGLDAASCSRLHAMLDAGLLADTHWIPWCDAQIERLAEIPCWLIEGSMTHEPGVLQAALMNHIRASVESNGLGWEDPERLEVCCYFLRYKRGDWDWRALLFELYYMGEDEPPPAGLPSMGDMLRDLDASAGDMEREQAAEIQARLAPTLAQVESDYRSILSAEPGSAVS